MHLGDVMKSLDVVVLCKLFILQSTGRKNWTYAQLAEETCLSVGEVHASVKRLKKSQLFDEFTKSVIPPAFTEFLVHGLKYVFPADIGTPTRGVAASHSASILHDEMLQSDADVYVWAYSQGKQKGLSIKPLSKNTPKAALKDPKLYDFLALIDAIRIGKTRERTIAARKIETMIQEMAGNDKS
jgi:DNA-binding Lrp family transcriptional regulator